jgi:hypothetical protein
MNPVYLNTKYLSQDIDKLMDESAVQLKQILNDNVYAKVQAATLKADTQDYFTESVTPPHGTGVRGDWLYKDLLFLNAILDYQISLHQMKRPPNCLHN